MNDQASDRGLRESFDSIHERLYSTEHADEECRMLSVERMCAGSPNVVRHRSRNGRDGRSYMHGPYFWVVDPGGLLQAPAERKPGPKARGG